MGRRSIEFTPEMVAQVEALASALPQRLIADYLGISDRTLRQRIRDDERVSSAYKKGRARAILGVATALMKRAMLPTAAGTTAAIFYLKTQGGWKETSRHEVAGADGEPFDLGALIRGLPTSEIERLEALGEAELRAEIERLAEEGRAGT